MCLCWHVGHLLTRWLPRPAHIGVENIQWTLHSIHIFYKVARRQDDFWQKADNSLVLGWLPVNHRVHWKQPFTLTFTPLLQWRTPPLWKSGMLWYLDDHILLYRLYSILIVIFIDNVSYLYVWLLSSIFSWWIWDQLCRSFPPGGFLLYKQVLSNFSIFCLYSCDTTLLGDVEKWCLAKPIYWFLLH